MIRRNAGKHFWLIRQTDHARLAGLLARHFGAGVSGHIHPATPDAVLATDQHDAGWDQTDDAGLLSRQGLPLDVFEIPSEIAFDTWWRSSTLAQSAGPRTQLLVSLHGLGLSAYSAAKMYTPREQMTADFLIRQFALNKYQHKELELQESLRPTLSLPANLPTSFGLADAGSSPAEDLLRFELRILQAMDLLSLAVCCSTTGTAGQEARSIVGAKTGEVHFHPSARAQNLYFNLVHEAELQVHPWPFSIDRIEVDVPFRPVPARPYASPEDLLEAIAKSQPRTLRAAVVRG
jgi:hypothetical protein